MDPLTQISTRRTPQRERADERQVRNSAGGYTFQIGDEARLHRFLTLGTTGGTYYIGERELTKQNADFVLKFAETRGHELVAKVAEISMLGRVPKQNPAIFALAAAASSSNTEVRQAALEALPHVCRTATHLFLFTQYVEQFRGWGRTLRRAVSRWYRIPEVDQVAYQAVKYRNRSGWSHRDVLRLSHPKTKDSARRALFHWIVSGERVLQENGTVTRAPGIVQAFLIAQESTSVTEWLGLIQDYPLSWEMLPDAALKEPRVWKALIRKGMPQTALMRQLPRLTRLGVLDDREIRSGVVDQLTDLERLRKGRVHPVNVLVAQKTYAQGHSDRGSSTWTPNRHIVDALDEAFYAAFGTIEPAGKRTLVALDVSGSMSWEQISGLPITPREASAALSLVTLATEKDSDVIGFTGGSNRNWSRAGVSELTISPRQRLDDVVRYTEGLPMGGTDCALPMIWAKEQGRVYDTFIVYTDSETWAGSIHPHQALRHYRETVNPQARLAVVGMTATDFTIADPTDPGQLDVAGFDSAVPNLISDFSRGDV